ncbi:MAG TPA: radical SAM protein [bacterium]|nr:radical SAM protein [bacterium]
MSSGGFSHLLGMAGMCCSVWKTRHTGSACRYLPLVHLDIEQGCNSRCVTCDSWRKKARDSGQLTTDEILSMLPAMKKLGTCIVSISGGEPALRPDLEEIVSGFSEAGIAVHVDTNCLCIDRARAESLVRAGLKIVYTSIDHFEPAGFEKIRGVDGLSRVISAIGYFRSVPQPVPVGVNITVSSLNCDIIPELVDNVIALGVQKIQFLPVHRRHGQFETTAGGDEFRRFVPEDTGRVVEMLKRESGKIRKRGIATNSRLFIDNFENAYRAVRTVPCYAGYLFAVIDPFGFVMPCYEHKTGMNVRDMELDEIFRSGEFVEARKNVKECKLPCMIAGNAEPSIRLHLPYIVRNLPEAYRQARMHTG